MKLHENKDLFKDAVIATAQQKNIREVYVEKDYWVTYALNTIFKGGTALAKCFGLIQRFSEDIDLVVLRNGEESGSQLKNKIRKISKCVSSVLPEVELGGITNKFGMIRKTAHGYEHIFKGNYGQIRKEIIIESTWLGNFEPYTKAMVGTFIYEMMMDNNQQALIEQYGMNPFEVIALMPKRTLCEKIMSLVRFSQTPDPITDLRNKIRHTYDIHQLLKSIDIYTFFQSEEFEEMLIMVANEDVISFKNNNKWLLNHPSTAILFSDTETIWNQLKNVYKTDFEELVFGIFPDEKDIMNTLIVVSDRLKNIEWTVKI